VSQPDSVNLANTGYDAAVVEQGQQLFTLCSACHGPDARGLPNLGKDLVASEFVAAQTDDALVQFIVTGRPIWDPLNTTGIDMPGKGGNPAMTTEDIQAIIAYIRTLSAENSDEAQAAPVSNESIAYDPTAVSQGEQLFVQCAACHGPNGRGLPNLGKDLVASEFAAGLTDDELMAFVKTGRPIWDPLNTTGIDMPGKGGNPALTDDDIMAIIAYIRSLSAGSG
jgi:disulfide bond formation protein DsbB